MDQLITIDGKKYEGGGQIMRLSLALSILTQQKFQITDIRASRPNPGINNQLKSQIELFTSLLIDCHVEGAKIGSKQLVFEPKKKLQTQKINCKGQSAQSVTLILQSLLPIAIFQNEKTEILIQGGTTVSNSPPITTYIQGFINYLQQNMGINIVVNIIKEGYYPEGGGVIQVIYTPSKLKAITMIDSNPIVDLKVEYLAPKEFDSTPYNNQILAVAKQYSQGVVIESNSIIRQFKKFKQSYGIICYAYNEINFYDFSSISSEDQTIQQNTEKVIKNMNEQMKNNPAIDDHLQDQLLLFAVLAEGKSILRVQNLTPHTEAAIYVIKKFLPQAIIEFENNLLTIEGLNFRY